MGWKEKKKERNPKCIFHPIAQCPDDPSGSIVTKFCKAGGMDYVIECAKFRVYR